ncbi:MAG: anaerobic ribonucleoside-triphosphate reductase activating protein [Lachnospiraceae bacterium]|nr:anaerobic ribonucleoside-triphosphate reductase activating protein [Lachnospiraceae bacterium]
MKILGFQKTTLLDYPEHIASIVFTGGCNFACPYCHNSELIRPSHKTPEIPEEEVLTHLKEKKGKIEGLVITGGEPTLQEDLYDFCKKVKELGMLIKLDTNGTNFELVSRLVDEHLLDYIALDAKMPAGLYKDVMPKKTTDTSIKKYTDSYVKCLEFLKKAPAHIDYEVRTTIVPDLLDTNSAEAMSRELSGIKKLYIQPFVNSDSVLVFGLREPTEHEMKYYRNVFRKHVKYVEIRGMDL